MLKDDMIVKKAIVHILDSTMAMPVLSDCELDLGSDLCDFFKTHIERFTEGDEVKRCQFSDDSVVRDLLVNCSPDNFAEVSKEMATRLFGIMNANIEIPPADVAILVFTVHQIDYIALLKMNYKSSYTHKTIPAEEGNANAIIRQKAILPSESQHLQEAFVVDLSTGEILLVERKYNVNDKKTNYFSELFLECHAPLSQKAKMDIVTRAVDQVNKKYYGEEDVDRALEVKSVIYKELEEEGSLKVEAIAEKLFSETPEIKEELETKLSKYNMTQEVLEPKAEKTVKKFQKQLLKTDTGIEISIPMEQYQNGECLEFVTNEDGTISVWIKNIGKLMAK